ncbi:hypothetical protein [Flavobacterium sp.]|uniref:hypothetical protein n=1 Tax=Flavobacterium sp. TaxID=239 RepID=UPI00121BE751|nr:hypothetical protein [Flavobacterium sp.]RZJ72577.1 MAG: hypothetical protein EOO49_06605 [Flavobacterium sp.]
MKKMLLLLLLLQFFISSCDNRNFLIETSNKNFEAYKLDFDAKFFDQFPKKITSPYTDIISNTNRRKNDIGLFLYENDVPLNKINQFKQRVLNSAIATYKATDTCLLVVNRFETEESYKSFERVSSIDSLQIDRDCAIKNYPVPNFISSNYSATKNKIKLDESFDIYVFEAKSGNNFPNYTLQPSPQMPKKWGNGYSKGVAISEKKK